jgi:hypothetical protein
MLGRTMNGKTIATGLKTAIAAGAMLAAGALATPATAQTHVKIGLLTCATGPTIGLIIASTEKARCTFHPDVGENENYSGHIRKFGLEVGVEAGSVIVWAVFSPQQGYAPGSLAGVYIGATAEASLVVGLGANVLIGGSKKQFALQPLSVQAQAGVNIAVGVGELDLTKR